MFSRTQILVALATFYWIEWLEVGFFWYHMKDMQMGWNQEWKNWLNG